MQNQKPKAFISCSLRDEDEIFNNLIIQITEKMGFQPVGTVGKFSASPKPIWQQMQDGIKNADCVVLVATTRYLTQDIHDKEKTGTSISELLHIELGMAISADRPVLVFVEKGTDVGEFISSIVQYIQIDKNDKNDLDAKSPLIANYFRSALTIIQEKWNNDKKANIWGIIKSVLIIIGGAKVLSSLLEDEDYEYY